jgi:hypothetical protein
MPPGTWHAVYTATPSFTSGGHFLMYDTMHLTEFSRAFDSSHSEQSTNANHQVDRILARLTLAFPTVCERRREHGLLNFVSCAHRCLVLEAVYRRPVLALARMILEPKRYMPQSEKQQRDLHLSTADVLAREEHFELVEAQGIMKKILTAINLSECELKAAVESTGARWFDRGEEIALPWTKHI